MYVSKVQCNTMVQTNLKCNLVTLGSQYLFHMNKILFQISKWTRLHFKQVYILYILY